MKVGRLRGLLRRFRRQLFASGKAALQQPRSVIYLSLQGTLVLVGSLLTATTGNVGTSVGASIIATGASGFVVFGWVLFGDYEQGRRREIEAFGFKRAFPNRSIQIQDEYRVRIASAAESIDVMGYGLNALREDFLGSFEEWSKRAAVRILLVAPDSPGRTLSFANLRDKEELQRRGRISDEVRTFVRDTEHLWANPDVRFDLRLAKCIPSVNIFRIDYEAFWGPYLVSSEKYGRTSRNLPTLIVGAPGFMYLRLVDHFNQIWLHDDYSRAPTSDDR